MTVQQLIDELNKLPVEDKALPVATWAFEDGAIVRGVWVHDDGEPYYKGARPIQGRAVFIGSDN